MCGRFTSLLSPELLAVIKEIFGIRTPESVVPRYNIAPTQQTWVIRSAGDHNRLDRMKWGLIPSWAKDPKIGNSLINARSETAHEKPSFRHAIKYNRCIIPASGFFEWLREGNKKLPNYIRFTDNGLMAFAGLWDHWKEPGTETMLETFTILTTSANDLVKPIHDRMPVILHPDDYHLWLNKNMHDPEQLRHMYQPFPSDQLTMYRVPDLVNSPANDTPVCITRV